MLRGSCPSNSTAQVMSGANIESRGVNFEPSREETIKAGIEQLRSMIGENLQESKLRMLYERAGCNIVHAVALHFGWDQGPPKKKPKAASSASASCTSSHTSHLAEPCPFMTASMSRGDPSGPRRRKTTNTDAENKSLAGIPAGKTVKAEKKVETTSAKPVKVTRRDTSKAKRRQIRTNVPSQGRKKSPSKKVSARVECSKTAPKRAVKKTEINSFSTSSDEDNESSKDKNNGDSMSEEDEETQSGHKKTSRRALEAESCRKPLWLRAEERMLAEALAASLGSQHEQQKAFVPLPGVVCVSVVSRMVNKEHVQLTCTEDSCEIEMEADQKTSVQDVAIAVAQATGHVHGNIRVASPSIGFLPKAALLSDVRVGVGTRLVCVVDAV